MPPALVKRFEFVAADDLAASDSIGIEQDNVDGFDEPVNEGRKGDGWAGVQAANEAANGDDEDHAEDDE